MNACRLLGITAVAAFSASALAQSPGIQFEATNRATFIYVQGGEGSRTASFDASTVVRINAGFVLTSASKSQVGRTLMTGIGLLPSADHPTNHSITMRAYWAPAPLGRVSGLSLPSGRDKTNVFRSDIVVGDGRHGMSLKLIGLAFTAN
ncbi:MAG TPA: hypothetical protein VGL56_08420 [Fimbriimonadaceae bacterium]|jgi:hypothetical protein